MSIAISMTLHRAADIPLATEDIARAYQQRWPDAEVTDVEDGESTRSMSIDGTPVVLGVMPAPLPASDLQTMLETSMLWPEGKEHKELTAELKNHGSHVICTVTGEAQPREANELLTRVTAAVLDADPESLGACWTNADMLIRKDIFTDFVEQVLPHGPPIMIWVKFALGPSPTGSGTAGFTRGMEALGLMELETVDAPESAEELVDRFSGLAAYLLDNGMIINDGDTIGESASEQIRVLHTDSSFGIEGKVLRLEYSSAPGASASASKPWWKFW